MDSYYLVRDNTLLAIIVLNVPTATNRKGDPNKFNERQHHFSLHFLYLANSVGIQQRSVYGNKKQNLKSTMTCTSTRLALYTKKVSVHFSTQQSLLVKISSV